MSTQVILPALGIAQDSGTIVRWLKSEGEEVAKGEPLAEIETDKATVEIEAPASGMLANVTGAVGVAIPVGQVIAAILAPGEVLSEDRVTQSGSVQRGASADAINGADALKRVPTDGRGTAQAGTDVPGIPASPLAQRMAAEHNLDIGSIQPAGRRIQKADVLAYMQKQPSTMHQADAINRVPTADQPRLLPASPKARRLAAEQGTDLAAIQGTGPAGAVLVADVLASSTRRADEILHRAGASPAPTNDLADAINRAPYPRDRYPTTQPAPIQGVAFEMATLGEQKESAVSTIWRIMAERTTQSWTSTPHFYLVREVNASRLVTWHGQVLTRASEKVTYSDLLVKIVAAALRLHPRVNASWREGSVVLHEEVHIGLAVAVEDGLVVPVIHRADTLGLDSITQQRKELVERAQASKLRPQDIQGGTFTISNLGMYGIDAFNAVINAPQAAILAVGRIAERVVPINGQPAVQPMVTLTLSCDHRVVDGARGAQFLDTVATFIEDPLTLLD